MGDVLLTEDDLQIWDAVLARLLRGEPMRVYMGWFLVSKASDQRDALMMQRIESARARELDETVDGDPLCGRSYVHSLMLASEIAPELAPAAFRVS